VEDLVDQLAGTIRAAGARKQALRIRAGGSKDFYGGELRGEVLDVRPCSGIVDYEPTELVITARAGTPLDEVERTMRAHGQMLAFEPPRFARTRARPGPAEEEARLDAAPPSPPPPLPGEAGRGTLGGAIAAGLSGPRRPYAGSARDLVLGVRMIDGQGTDLRFGGRVMKNVAGYDVSRFVVGSLGTLGLLLEVSLKALPRPAGEATLRLEMSQAQAIAAMNAWAGKPLPISATCHCNDVLHVRLSGPEAALRAARAHIGGEPLAEAEAFWAGVRDHELDFFRGARTLWRLSIKSTTEPLGLHGPQLVEWNGALRWLAGDCDASEVRTAAARSGGHATLFRGGNRSAGVFHPLAPALMKLNRRLKETFDPHGILNPGRLYPGL
jgi:glycolate oxidase FAD binding subunit